MWRLGSNANSCASTWARSTANPATDTGAGVGGWYAALQNYSGNLNVATGANLRYALGVLVWVSF